MGELLRLEVNTLRNTEFVDSNTDSFKGELLEFEKQLVAQQDTISGLKIEKRDLKMEVETLKNTLHAVQKQRVVDLTEIETLKAELDAARAQLGPPSDPGDVLMISNSTSDG